MIVLPRKRCGILMKLKRNEKLTYFLELIFQNEIAVLEPLIEG